ncbi:MAG: tRNA glutamyl-Q(34) synthetase GluQRS, partial [Gammaproteobacteria bacterium]|nr:tRNA glutamyl-Q(34) synthetase GluQRS [Gammaproteobacteria bacterium]
PALGHALALLGLPPPAGLAAAPPAELLAWARPRWALARVPRAPAVQADPRAAG